MSSPLGTCQRRGRGVITRYKFVVVVVVVVIVVVAVVGGVGAVVVAVTSRVYASGG